MNSLCHRYLNQNILPFVGREQELKRLKSLYRQFLEEGETKYVLITGESGSGKSRLVREFEDYLSKEFAEACVAIHVRYLEGNAAALTPIINAFAAMLGHHEGIRQFLEHLRLLPGGNLRFLGEAPDDSVDHGPPPLQVLLDSLSEIAKRFPLVLILEDVHNIEDLPLFDQFFLGLSTAAKFVILTERTGLGDRLHGRASEPFMREIALREERSSDVISLGDLQRDDIDRLFSILFEMEPSSALVSNVVDSTAGRPLNLRTMLRQLVTTGSLQYENASWFEDPHATLAETESSAEGEEETLVRFQRELERLNEQELIVAMHAAVLGEQFDIRLVSRLITERLGESALTPELFQRAIDLLTFKSIIRPATPSIYLAWEAGAEERTEIAGNCYEFSHQHFWNTVLENARKQVTGQHDLILTIVSIAVSAHLPLYSSAFLAVSGPSFMLKKFEMSLPKVEVFLFWASQAVRSLWSVEPQQALKLLVSLSTIRDEITWRFGPDLSEAAMSALLELHSLLVEAFHRTGSLREAERDLEHAAVLEKFIQSAKSYHPAFQGTAKGKVATLRALLAASRTDYPEFERWATVAREALTIVDQGDIERARLLALLTRTKAEALLNVGRLKEADALIEEEMPNAQLLRNNRFDEYCLYYRVAVTSKLKQGQNAQASELTERIISQAKARGNTLIETTFLFQAALASFSTGNLIEARSYCDMGIANGRRYGIRFVEIMSNLWRMIIAGVEQDVDNVRECSQQLANLVEDARIVAQAPNLLQRISLIEGRSTTMNFLGRHHAALEYAEEAIQLAGTHHQDSFAAWAQNEKSLALNGLGRFEEARNVASECLAMCGEQRLAARTARTALMIAYTGLDRLEDAWLEADILKSEFDERNPYYFRYALAELRLLRLSLSSPKPSVKARSTVPALRVKIEALLDVLSSWAAMPLREALQKEFADLMPKKEALEAIDRSASAKEAEMKESGEVAPKLLLHTFGPLRIELTEDSKELAAPLSAIVQSMGRETKVRDSKVRQLLALLIAARIEYIDGNNSRTRGGLSKETLVDLLWPDSDFTNGSNALYTTIKRLRAFLGDAEAIEFTEGSYCLSKSVVLDCELLLHHYDDARQAAKRNAMFSVTFHYEQILRLSGKGAFMEGIYASWLDGLRTRLETIRRNAAIRLIETNLERGLLDKVEELCHFLHAQDEYDEEALRGLLIVSSRRRQTARLYSLYDTFAKKLKDEFKAEPSEDIRKLYTKLSALPEAAASI